MTGERINRDRIACGRVIDHHAQIAAGGGPSREASRHRFAVGIPGLETAVGKSRLAGWVVEGHSGTVLIGGDGVALAFVDGPDAGPIRMGEALGSSRG